MVHKDIKWLYQLAASFHFLGITGFSLHICKCQTENLHRTNGEERKEFLRMSKHCFSNFQRLDFSILSICFGPWWWIEKF